MFENVLELYIGTVVATRWPPFVARQHYDQQEQGHVEYIFSPLAGSENEEHVFTHSSLHLPELEIIELTANSVSNYLGLLGNGGWLAS